MGAAEAGVEVAEEAVGCSLTFRGSHALSSNPVLIRRSGFGGAAGAVVRGVGTASVGVAVPFSLEAKALASTTSFVSTAGAGRPFLVLFLMAPPAPANRPPFAVSPLVAAPSIGVLCRPNLLSRCFITRRMSPSLRPSVRSSVGVISCWLSSPISSR